MTRPLPVLAGAMLALSGCGAMVETSAPVTSATGATATATPPSTLTATATATPSATATPTPTATATATATATLPGARHVHAAPAAVTRRLNHLTAVAERQYNRETGGAVVHADLRQIAGDTGLRAAARTGNVAMLRAYVQGRFPAWYHLHVSRLQILRGGRTIVDLGVPFVVDGPQARLPGGDTLRISIQDEIGFVRLIHRHNPVELLVRGRDRGHIRTSLPAAANVTLPSRGPVTIGGRRYEVRSFARTALGGEPVTIWVLARG